MQLLIAINIYLSLFSGPSVKNAPDTSIKAHAQIFTREKGLIITTENGNVVNIEIDSVGMTKRDTNTRKFHILYIVNQKGKEPLNITHMVYSTNTIVNEQFFPAIGHPDQQNDGVAVVNLKPDVKLLTLADIYRSYKISKPEQQLPVYVNFQAIDKPGQLIAADGAIQGVYIDTDLDKVRFLNIITNDWAGRHQPKQITIHLR